MNWSTKRSSNAKHLEWDAICIYYCAGDYVELAVKKGRPRPRPAISVQGKTARLIEVFLSNMRYVLNLEDGIELIFGLPKQGLFEVDTDEWESMRICSEYCFIFL